MHRNQNNNGRWIQWTFKDTTGVLWACDLEMNKAVEVLRVSEKQPTSK
jgi:hypothetical protein